MPKIVPIVEGPGEVEAVPALLWRLLTEMERYDIQVGDAQNAHGCGNLTVPGGVEKFVGNAWTKRDCGAVLILMDAEEQCAMQLATDFSKRIRAMGVRFPVATVIAKCEFEAWFLASLETMTGERFGNRQGLPVGLSYPGEVEQESRGQGLDHEAIAGRAYLQGNPGSSCHDPFDRFGEARQRSRSFPSPLPCQVEQAVNAIDTGQVIVTPEVLL